MVNLKFEMSYLYYFFSHCFYTRMFTTCIIMKFKVLIGFQFWLWFRFYAVISYFFIVYEILILVFPVVKLAQDRSEIMNVVLVVLAHASTCL